MDIENRKIEELLPGYLSGELTDDDRAIVDSWRKESSDNEELFRQYMQSWEAIPLLSEMEQFNSFKALQKINSRISAGSSGKFVRLLQRAAAILIVPLLLYSGYVTVQNLILNQDQEEQVMMQTVTSRQGMVSQFMLADGTKVWLNSGSELQFPSRFTGSGREVKLIGEAFFEVKKNPDQPFRVITKNIQIEDIGTSFNVESYADENLSEVILVEGEVRLTSQTPKAPKSVAMTPGQRAVYREDDPNFRVQNVDVDKYIAWRDGTLMFRDDNMGDVVRRLGRWFNVEIIVNDPEIESYTYMATFRSETLTQVLNLLKLSAPIDYKIVDSQLLANGEHTRQKVYIMKKTK